MGESARTAPTDLARAGRETRASVASRTCRVAGDPIRSGCRPNRLLERDDHSNRSHRMSAIEVYGLLYVLYWLLPRQREVFRIPFDEYVAKMRIVRRGPFIT